MAKLILVTGGSRSGKSEFARKIAESYPGRRGFIATCPITDREMQNRINKHKELRKDSSWMTIEEQINISESMAHHKCDVYLIDCLTLWINNFLYYSTQENTLFDEAKVSELCTKFLSSCSLINSTIVMVTGEIGSGIVPDNEAARLYRDLVGRCNQIMAAACDEVYLVSCGLPLQLKPRTMPCHY